MISEKTDSANNDQSPIQARATTASSGGARWYGDSRHTDDDTEDLSAPPDYILPRSNKTSTSGDSDDTNDDANDANGNVGHSANEVDPDEHLTDKVYC